MDFCLDIVGEGAKGARREDYEEMSRGLGLRAGSEIPWCQAQGGGGRVHEEM